MIDHRIVIPEKCLQEQIETLSKAVSGKYGDHSWILAVVILEGGRRFFDDFKKHLDIDFDIAYIRASSYNGGTQTTGTITIQSDIDALIEGRDILLIDDIYDTGLTLKAVTDYMHGLNAKSVKTCVLLEKLKPHRVEIPVDFCAIRVEDSFLIGYGLDYKGKYRDLPYIAAVDK